MGEAKREGKASLGYKTKIGVYELYASFLSRVIGFTGWVFTDHLVRLGL